MEKKKEGSDKDVKNSEQHPVGIIGVLLLLCAGVFVLLWGMGVFGRFQHEEGKEIAVKMSSDEEICFQNLLLSASMINYELGDGYTPGFDENITKEICIFNTGNAYYFEWTSSYPRYYGEWGRHRKGSNGESVWEGMENMVYLGRLTEQETEQLCQYVSDFNSDGEYYRNEQWYGIDTGDTVGTGPCIELYYRLDAPSLDPYEWKRYIVVMYQHSQIGADISGETTIEHCRMNYKGENIEEKTEILEKSYEENVLAALELFENSEIYEKWVEMSLNP